MSSENETKAKAGAIIVPVTLFEQNCTILWDAETKQAVVFDPGGDVPRILAAIEKTAVKVEKINPTVEVVSYDTLTLDHTGQEATAVRFRVADSGSVSDINHRDKSLIQLTRSVRRSGAK